MQAVCVTVWLFCLILFKWYRLSRYTVTMQRNWKVDAHKGKVPPYVLSRKRERERDKARSCVEIISTLLKLQPLFTPTASLRFHKRLFLADLPDHSLCSDASLGHMKTSVCSSCPPTSFSAVSPCLSMWSFLAKQLSVWVSSDPAHCIPLLLFSPPGTRRGLCPLSTHMQRSFLRRIQWNGRAWSDLKNVFTPIYPSCVNPPKQGLRFCLALVIRAGIEYVWGKLLVFNPRVCPARNYPLNNLNAYQRGLIQISVSTGEKMTGLRFQEQVLDFIPQLDILGSRCRTRVSNKMTFDLVNEGRF